MGGPLVRLCERCYLPANPVDQPHGVDFPTDILDRRCRVPFTRQSECVFLELGPILSDKYLTLIKAVLLLMESRPPAYRYTASWSQEASLYSSSTELLRAWRDTTVSVIASARRRRDRARKACKVAR